jgi:thiol-disulfide isomerase/thioredoxin
MTTVTATLYYADWCTYCTRFMPEWEKLSRTVRADKLVQGDATFKVNKIEAGNEPVPPQINGKDISGFPTVKVVVKSNSGTREFEYQGKRNADELQVYLKMMADRAV